MIKLRLAWLILLIGLLQPCPSEAVEAAPALTDREIAERLARLEEGQAGLRADMQQLRADMTQQNDQLRDDVTQQIQQLRADMTEQNEQLRADMTEQFARQFQLTLALLAAFSAPVAAIIGFILWNRQTMLRPFERSVRSLEDEISTTRRRQDALVAAFHALGQHNPEVAGVLRQFPLR